MTDPIVFASTTPRLGLPNLFAAQAQREITINEAFAILDALVHGVVDGEANDPPASADDGQCWIVGSQPTGDWASHAGQIACRQSGAWLFVAPIDGMVVFDGSASRIARFDNGWIRTTGVSAPSGGSVVDVEARAAISELIDALAAAGIIAPA